MSLPNIKEYIVDTVNLNFSDPSFNVQELSYQLRISGSYLRELTIIHFGVNPQKYIETRRLEYSLELLKDELLVRDIATRAGYNSIHSFEYAFKKRINIAPGRMKEILKKSPTKSSRIVQIYKKKLFNV